MMNEKVALVKLVNGELLIGVAQYGLKGDTLEITKPLQIGVVQDQIAFIDFNGQLSDDEKIVVSKHNVLYQYTASEPVAVSYHNRTSNIQLPEISDQIVS